MTEMVSREIVGTRKLILGFDAGCGTCSDLAGRIQERVGDKLSVENLNDPQLIAWREEALGKNAKWTPTLFEVEGEKVLKVWAGWRMGYALSRELGPSSTWQIMQALGEVGGAPKVEDSAIVEKLPEKAAETVVGMSRGQFLKGVGGAAVAASVLSSGVLFPSAAEAAVTGPRLTRGTTRQRALAKSVVQNSAQFKKQLARQRSIGARFNLDSMLIKVVDSLAIVRIRSTHRKRTVTLVFLVSIPKKTVSSYIQQDIYPRGDNEAKVFSYANGKPMPRYHSLTFRGDKIIMPNGRQMSLAQFKREAENNRLRSQQLLPQQEGFNPAPNTPCNRCFRRAKLACVGAAGGACGAVGAGAGLFASPVGALVVGGISGAGCAIYAEFSGGCSNFARSARGGCLDVCSDKKPPSSRSAPPTGSC